MKPKQTAQGPGTKRASTETRGRTAEGTAREQKRAPGPLETPTEKDSIWVLGSWIRYTWLGRISTIAAETAKNTVRRFGFQLV